MGLLFFFRNPLWWISQCCSSVMLSFRGNSLLLKEDFLLGSSEEQHYCRLCFPLISLSQNISVQEMCCPLVVDTEGQGCDTGRGSGTDRKGRTDPGAFGPPNSSYLLFFILSLTLPSLKCAWFWVFFWQTPCASPAGELPALTGAPQRVCAAELGSSWPLPPPQVLHERGEVSLRFELCNS